MSKDRYERRHRRTWRHPESVAFMASADFGAVPPLAEAMGAAGEGGPAMTQRLSPPGSADGPCLNACHHQGCDWSRSAAAATCRLCGDRIDYGRDYYDHAGGPVHADCWEGLLAAGVREAWAGAAEGPRGVDPFL